ncbi:hypothetical protein QBC47DRAFT_84464 [Echria macrotheca]|uniref:Uncharacterized protein n=1 Tax=Echria macrotheca TaxID=438768 RepID=A0AAJ0B3P6_9PEZI|nr:hypothetical protein QBC47DRAFT_84464 [Echria macrotheca]
MAVRYRPLLGPDTDNGQELEGPISPLSPTSTARSRSTTATGTASPLPSPTPSNYLTLAEQTFTPLSMEGSDFGMSENADDDGFGADAGNEEKETAAVLERAGLLRAPGAEKQTRMRAGSVLAGRGPGGSSSTAPGQGPATGATIVSAMVQSFEALQAARAATGYHLVPTKTTASGHRHPDTGLVSPPSTVSPSLSPSPSRSPALDRESTRNPGPSPAVSPSPPFSAAATRNVVGAHPAPPESSVAAQNSPRDENTGPKAASGLGNTIADAANPLVPSTTVSVDFALSTATPASTLIRSDSDNSPPRSPQFALPPEPLDHPIVRTSSTASLTITHPTPDPNRRSRSGAYLGNIAALEATAERLSMTSSIEEAIREEHNELKRSDSRRSSILAGSVSGRKTSSSDSGSVFSQPRLSIVSRQSSIVGLNSAARIGGYSPGGYIMSPHPSLTGASVRLRSGSKTSSIGVPGHGAEDAGSTGYTPDTVTGEAFPFVTRHGPGKSSTRSVASKLSYVEAAELEHPTALTHRAFEEADRAAATGMDLDDDDTIRASAYQHIEAQFADAFDDHANASQPMLSDDMDEATPRFELQDPHDQSAYDQRGMPQSDERPMTAASNATYEQAQNAFGDFDGVHCDPDADGFVPPPMPELLSDRRPPPRPKSYFDPSTGQQMLYYPAPVPAMLNLPPKLSKKPKAAARNMRRSELLSVMPQASRESRTWLPDPMEGLRGSRDDLPSMMDFMGNGLGARSLTSDRMSHIPDQQGENGVLARPSHARQPSETSTILAPVDSTSAAREIRRPQRLTDPVDKRQTQASQLEGLPPQLRASAFFDLPATVPRVEIKGGSAMATLDSILDASATAPVSAFTDHAFAGKLGSEVYGAEKKKKKKANNRKTVMASHSTPDLLHPDSVHEPKKRASHFSLLGGRRKQSQDLDADDGRTSVGLVNGEQGARRDGTSPVGEDQPLSPNEMDPDTDEESSGEEEEEEEELYQGPPTTLLAELQLRKQRNKMRTRPMAHAYTNGMHSTLLELDAVAEVERKARKGKRVNLAWEDPNANQDHNDEVDDEDVPLGMLAVAKAKGISPGNMDISAVMSEVHRPLGLMERRELEDNEPLSRRRERLQGRQSGLVPPTLDVVQQRISQLGISPYGSHGNLGLRSQSRLTLPMPSPGAGSVNGAADADDDEGETLAARKARLAAENPLPVARPVSGMFSSELLSQFGGPEEENGPSATDKGKGLDTGKAPGDVPEEEETLGQRRRRLQAEREAREREMAAAGLPVTQSRTMTLMPTTGNMEPSRLSRRLSMADVLGAHPSDATRIGMDPREEQRLRLEAETMRAQRDKDMKMAALRAQMPTAITTPSFGARTGGYMGGKFNDGSGGNPAAGGLGLGFGAGAAVMQQQRMSAIPPAAAGMYGMPMPAVGAQYAGGPMQMGFAPQGYGAPMPMAMQMNGQGGHVDMVEKWRQGVMP